MWSDRLFSAQLMPFGAPLRKINDPDSQARFDFTMIFRCPNTKLNVQGWTADDVSDDGNTYLPQECLACRQIHYVNPSTGRVLGSDDADDEIEKRLAFALGCAGQSPAFARA